ncbi:MAG: VOC family protein [Candidatus Dormibacteraeota bacterium]|nr:VOC family protein [Candidatus Dormibacteraeota bacterium]MBV9525495.1 VOC family protein [Candidatus Dormibacteraeota bacterium]
MGCVLREIVFDCADAKRVAAFWSQVLDWPLKEDDDGLCWLSSTGEPTAPAPLLVFIPVPEPKTVKNRVHIDVNPSGADQDEELERLLALGARRVDIGQGDVPWVVLADAEGNEFCLLKRRVDALSPVPPA